MAKVKIPISFENFLTIAIITRMPKPDSYQVVVSRFFLKFEYINLHPRIYSLTGGTIYCPGGTYPIFTNNH